MSPLKQEIKLDITDRKMRGYSIYLNRQQTKLLYVMTCGATCTNTVKEQNSHVTS